MEYTDRLRRLAINDARFVAGAAGEPSFVEGVAGDPGGLDARSSALVRLAGLIAVGGAEPSYGAQVDAAISAGATASEIVDVLIALIPVVGLPCVVAAAPKLGLALGYDTAAALE